MIFTRIWDHQQAQEEVEEEQHDLELYSLKHKIPKVIHGTLDEDAYEEQ